MQEGGSFLNIDLAVLFQQSVAFLILFLLLRRYLFRPLLRIMSQREREIAEGLESAAKAKEELARIDEERKRLLTAAREEGREQVRQAVHEGEEARERMLREAREETRALRQRAQETVELEREQAMVELRRSVVDLALLAASRSVLGRLDAEQHRKAVDDFVQSLEQEH